MRGPSVTFLAQRTERQQFEWRGYVNPTITIFPQPLQTFDGREGGPTVILNVELGGNELAPMAIEHARRASNDAKFNRNLNRFGMRSSTRI